MSRAPYDAVVFDLDGTLVDSRIAVVEAVAAGVDEALRAAGEVPPPLDANRIRGALGKPADEYFRAILPPTLGHLADAVKEAATRHEVEAFASGHGRLFAGVLESLVTLRAAGIQLAVVSNAQGPYFRAALQYTGIDPLLAWRECYEELPAGSARPFKTTLLQRALVQLGTAPARTLMVGDRAEDLQAGAATGCATLGIPFGFGTADEMALADRELRSFADLPSVVGL